MCLDLGGGGVRKGRVYEAALTLETAEDQGKVSMAAGAIKQRGNHTGLNVSIPRSRKMEGFSCHIACPTMNALCRYREPWAG